MKQAVKGAWRLISLFGIGIYVHWTFLLLFIYLGLSQAYLKSGFESTVLLFLLVLAVFATVVLHELGHALTARRYGCTTRDIVLLPIGGMARMDRLPDVPKEEVYVSLAGPLVNVILAVLIYVFFFIDSGVPAFSVMSELTIRNWMAHFYYANVVLALFNLIPAYPMDGGRILHGLLSLRLDRLKATRVAVRIGQLIAMIMILSGLYSNAILAFVGVFVLLAAQMELTQSISREFLRGAKVKDVIMPNMDAVAADSTLREVVDQLLHTQTERFVVFKGDLPVGTIDRKLLFEEIGLHGQDVFVETCMRRGIQTAEADDPLEKVFASMQADQTALLLVKENGSFKGYLDFENIMEFVSYRQSLRKHATVALHA